MLKTGNVYMTSGIKECISEGDGNIVLSKIEEVKKALKRHAMGDWGDISEDDKQVNEEALKNGDQILSAYNLSFGKIWIITEWDRKTTTILFPSEY